MERTELKRGAKEVALAAALSAAFYLFAAALFAVFVRAYAPPQGVVTAVNWSLKALAPFLFSLLFVRRGASLLKGALAGAAGCIAALFLFAAIGGGFYVTALFPLELLLTALMGALGALLSVKLRKED